jgi:MFS family permease
VALERIDHLDQVVETVEGEQDDVDRFAISHCAGHAVPSWQTMESGRPPEPPPRPSLRRAIIPLALTAAGIGALVYFLAPYRHAIGVAVDRASVPALLAITALSFLALPLRTEMWRTGLLAAGRRPPRSDLHAANSASFLVSLANHYLGPWVKMWILRRMEGERAMFLLQLVAVDLGNTVIEAALAGVLVVIATFEVAIAWWIPVLLLAGAGGLLILALAGRRRFPEHPIIEGLGVLMRPRYRWRVLALTALVFAVQILRTYLSMRTVGVHLGLGNATLVFVLTGVLGFLPSGISAAPSAASLIVIGSSGVGRAAAAGIVVTGSLVVATLLYCALAALVRLRVRGRRVSVLESVG